jgi:predicted Ser/Thr protein kinase
MSDITTCPRCGTKRASTDETCPRCLLELGRTPPEPAPGVSRSVPRPRRRAAPSVEEIARRFPELEVLGLIGEGGMGAVYRARQTRIERPIALKVLALDPSDDPTFAERFRREAMVLARLDHPNVVKLYDFGEREGLFFLVLELVEGTNLRTLMQRGLLEPAQALAIVPQICEALQFAHDEGVVHRDIKPENVLIDTKGRVKIADFGLAKLVGTDAREVSLTEVDQIVGTPHYMAPEQLRGSRDVDHRADIYSLGVVFYEMLTGELPRGKFELPSKRIEVDVRFDDIVLKSLERTPERRYQHAVEVKTDVEDVGRYARPAKRAQVRVVVHPNKPWEFFLTFLVLWPLVGLMFNGGAWWFTLGMALVGATFWSQIEHAIKARPELEAALASQKRGVRAARHLAALVLLGIGLFALYAGHIALFETTAPGYRSGPSDPNTMREAPTRLFPILDQRMRLGIEEGQRVLGDLRGKAISLKPEGVWEIDLERLWRSPALLVLAALSIGGAAFTLSAGRAGLTGQVTGTLLGSLLVVELLCGLLSATRAEAGPLAPVSMKLPHTEGGTAGVSGRLRIALVERGYAVTSNAIWSDGPARMEVVFADPASPLDRWRISWFGPERVLPHAVFVLAGPADSGQVGVACDLGDIRLNDPARTRWEDWGGTLLGKL